MKKIFKNPLCVAVLSSLIGVAIAFAATCIYDAHKFNEKRESAFRIIFTNLHEHKKHLNGLEETLGQDQVNSALDSVAIINFLTSDIINLAKDKILIEKLYSYLHDVKLIEHAINRIDMKAAGFTSVQSNSRKKLEISLKNAISGIKLDLDGCIGELLSYKYCSDIDATKNDTE